MLRSHSTQLLSFMFFIIGISTSCYSQEIFKQVLPNESLIKGSEKILSDVDYYEVNIPFLKRKLNTKSFIEFDIPFGDKRKTLSIQKTNILSPKYQLFTSSGKKMNTSRKYSFYHGEVKGSDGSKVALIFYNDTFSISIWDQNGNYQISQHEGIYAGYFDHNYIAPITKEWECTVIDESEGKEKSSSSRSTSSPECITVFFEIDHNMYNKHGGSTENAEEWAMTMFNQVAILYIEYDIPINISGIQVWDIPDPYLSTNNTSQALSLFRNTVHDNPNFNGRLAHLLSGRSLGGGIAYLNQLCSSFSNVAVSANMNSGNVPYPNYSWNVGVVAHEMGHNLGSPHTQSCSWNGNGTAIDGCGAIEGSCADPGNPPNNVGGTIMSYCHLLSVGINFNNGFGPQPGQLIYEKYSNASCETGENCASVPPFNDICNRAKEIPVLNYCVEGIFNNNAVTPSGDGGNMSCGTPGAADDIWFNFEYLDVDSITIEIQATDIISDLIVEIYSGDCNSLVSIDCEVTTNGSSVSFTIDDPSLIGEFVYMRIVEDGSDEEGEFSICVFAPDLPCQTQFDTLLTIYETLNGASWTNNQGWESGYTTGSCDYCNWKGITCDYMGQIIKLDLSDNNLQGELPEEISTLMHLKQLNLSSNSLIDTIPDFWDSLDYLLVLDMRDNQFTGTIPKSYSTMTRINKIHLDYNMLDSIPYGLGYNGSLRTFTASNNILQGCFVNGISSFCYKDSIDLTNNPGLPYSGDVTLLCENGWGTDWDLDGYCNEVEDCDDFDDEINPDADEILCDAIDNNCNGMVDEGSDFGPNIWIGPDTLGVFDNPTNWSLGHVPLICENVEIGTNGNNLNLILLGNDTSGGQGEGSAGGYSTLQIRNLAIGSNSTVYLGDTTGLSILGNGVLINNGSFIAYGYFNISDQKGTNNTAFFNNGSYASINNGGLSIQEIGKYGIHNTTTGTMSFSGYSNIYNFNNEIAKKAILNEGIITVHGYITISGSYTEEEVLNTNGGDLIVKNGGELTVYE